MGDVAEKWLRPVAHGHPEQYRDLRARLVTHWDLLERDTWTPLLAAAEQDGDEHPTLGDDWRRTLQALVLECAVRWSIDGNVSTTRVRLAAARAVKLDSEIMATAESLAALIEERSQITREHGLPTEWGGPNLDLWDLIERASMDFLELRRVRSMRLR